jgi:heterodisulfide reductase subunit C/uncharacterized membrane protein
MIAQILFAACLAIGVFFFARKIREVSRLILLGRPLDRTDRKAQRWKTMAKVALGQSKMGSRPVAAFFHVLIYVGFIIINIEVLEIILDGLTGEHRLFAFLGGFYDFLIASFEILAVAVLIACVVFLARRNLLPIQRFRMSELNTWPKQDANIILVAEVLLMSAFLIMNAADKQLQLLGSTHYPSAGSFPVSGLLLPLLHGLPEHTLILIERSCWWFHILGILAFLNYVPYSKHFHILLAFPNTWYSKLDNTGKLDNLEKVTQEVKLMMDPSAPVPTETPMPERFGAKDVRDLTWKQLMDAYSCTECGRCTSACPANITGKKLSPRKIMMDTRDRLEETGRLMAKHGSEHNDGKSLLHDYITPEELWACTSCNACVQECPVLIDPLSIIIELRRYMVMEESSAPSELNGMFTKIENNGAPWQFSPADRMNWAENNS